MNTVCLLQFASDCLVMLGTSSPTKSPFFLLGGASYPTGARKRQLVVEGSSQSSGAQGHDAGLNLPCAVQSHSKR